MLLILIAIYIFSSFHINVCVCVYRGYLEWMGWGRGKKECFIGKQNYNVHLEFTFHRWNENPMNTHLVPSFWISKCLIHMADKKWISFIQAVNRHPLTKQLCLTSFPPFRFIIVVSFDMRRKLMPNTQTWLAFIIASGCLFHLQTVNSKHRVNATSEMDKTRRKYVSMFGLYALDESYKRQLYAVISSKAVVSGKFCFR